MPRITNCGIDSVLCMLVGFYVINVIVFDRLNQECVKIEMFLNEKSRFLTTEIRLEIKRTTECNGNRRFPNGTRKHWQCEENKIQKRK